MKKYSSLVLLVTLSFCWLTIMASVGHVRAADVIYIHIKGDGTIDPIGAPITQSGDVYTLTNNITISATYNVGIMVERNNMTLDGAGYTLKGPNAFTDGIRTNSQNNVTIENMRITGFWGYPIRLDFSEQCLITKNNISASMVGIFLADYASNNGVIENILENSGLGIYIGGTASSNSIIGNDIKDGSDGVYIEGPNSFNNSIINNNMIGNSYGIKLTLAAANSHIHHNNFINNAVQFSVSANSYPNYWDNGTQGGNYWSDYGLRYPEVSERDSTGMWNTSYVIDSNNQDRYPLMSPIISEFPSIISLIFGVAMLSSTLIFRETKRKVRA